MYWYVLTPTRLDFFLFKVDDKFWYLKSDYRYIDTDKDHTVHSSTMVQETNFSGFDHLFRTLLSINLITSYFVVLSFSFSILFIYIYSFEQMQWHNPELKICIVNLMIFLVSSFLWSYAFWNFLTNHKNNHAHGKSLKSILTFLTKVTSLTFTTVTKKKYLKILWSYKFRKEDLDQQLSLTLYL